MSFQRSVEFPTFVRGIEIVRRDEDLESMRFRGLEDALHVLNSIVFLKTFADQGPRESFFAQDLVLRIDEYNCGVFPMDVHIISGLSFQVAETGLKAGPGLTDNGSMRQFVLP
jgi:hypothetical protein